MRKIAILTKSAMSSQAWAMSGTKQMYIAFMSTITWSHILPHTHHSYQTMATYVSLLYAYCFSLSLQSPPTSLTTSSNSLCWEVGLEDRYHSNQVIMNPEVWNPPTIKVITSDTTCKEFQKYFNQENICKRGGHYYTLCLVCVHNLLLL